MINTKLTVRMNRISILILLELIIALSGKVYAQEIEGTSIIKQAVEYCEGRSIGKVEGIWRFAEDGLTVWIRQTGFERYEMVVVDSQCGKLVPGMIFGELMRSGEENKFKMTVYGKGNAIKHRSSLVATLNDMGDVIGLLKGKFDFRVNLLGYLPYVSRLLRISYKDPSRNLVPGLFKVYPSYDGNGSSRLKARKL